MTGVHVEEGLTTGDSEEAYMKKALSDRAAETIVLASSEKIGVSSPFLIGPIEKISGLIVDNEATEESLSAYRDLGVSIIKAG